MPFREVGENRKLVKKCQKWGKIGKKTLKLG